jgi:hypothetical protein
MADAVAETRTDERDASPWRAVGIFLLLTICLTGVFWALIIARRSLASGRRPLSSNCPTASLLHVAVSLNHRCRSSAAKSVACKNSWQASRSLPWPAGLH